ncbi:MAG: hypothetical protein R3D85_07275 [Paracoccaceae bacterium]
MSAVVIVGCGFVADLYAAGLKTFPGIRVLGAHDRDPARLSAFTAHWTIPPSTGSRPPSPPCPPTGWC